MNQRRVVPAPLISGTIRSRGPDPRAPLPTRTCSLPNRPGPTSRRPGRGGGPRSPAARHRPSAGLPRNCGRPGRTSGTSPAPPATRRTDAHLHGRRRDPQRRPARPPGRFISSTGHSATRPVIWWIATLYRSSRNTKYVLSACERASRVPFAASRSTWPKYASASPAHLPQRAAEPRPQLLQVQHVAIGSCYQTGPPPPGPGRTRPAHRSRTPAAHPARPERAPHAGLSRRPGPSPGLPCLH